ncbi:uncharacterized protein K452DRAFT_30654 [Aplosporella prunicola CBS 121167]|uniref:Uncharacterized protein n=1 Tax=Aplosporella prunicola CBS 121167 TaxID=1176127 RepID=A0A6A6BGE2_9PEZI|nr:uncharacterized protein K452DRAFT_30654 [Aplosporella prunicola CBS 121167]KAF2141591.1 hypothetical protein K452DRAFT_30654 [Aplosporella prunicola CBS 121167]
MGKSKSQPKRGVQLLNTPLGVVGLSRSTVMEFNAIERSLVRFWERRHSFCPLVLSSEWVAFFFFFFGARQMDKCMDYGMIRTLLIFISSLLNSLKLTVFLPQ